MGWLRKFGEKDIPWALEILQGTLRAVLVSAFFPSDCTGYQEAALLFQIIELTCA
jgi:hypothetical protein